MFKKFKKFLTGCLLGLGVYYKIMTVEYAEIFRGGILSVPIFMIVVSSKVVKSALSNLKAFY